MIMTTITYSLKSHTNPKYLWLLALLLLCLALVIGSSQDLNVAGMLEAPETTAFVVQGQDMESVAQAVLRVGGEITHELGIINAVGAELTAEQKSALEASSGVNRIYDTEVRRPEGD
jgi:hypothetical protein